MGATMSDKLNARLLWLHSVLPPEDALAAANDVLVVVEALESQLAEARKDTALIKSFADDLLYAGLVTGTFDKEDCDSQDFDALILRVVEILGTETLRMAGCKIPDAARTAQPVTEGE